MIFLAVTLLPMKSTLKAKPAQTLSPSSCNSAQHIGYTWTTFRAARLNGSDIQVVSLKRINGETMTHLQHMTEHENPNTPSMARIAPKAARH